MTNRITLPYRLSVSIHPCSYSSTLRQACHNIAISYTCRTKKSLAFTIERQKFLSLLSELKERSHEQEPTERVKKAAN